MDTVTTSSSAKYKINNSKFLGYLAPCSDTQKLDETLERIRAEHPAASHHCYAYRLDPAEPVEFSTDAGEPGGSAGVPILNVLRSRGLINVACVVVRYYGGTKLGKSGLIDAYSHTATLAADAAKLKELVLTERYRITYGYEHQSLINSVKHTFDLIEIESVYLEKVSLTFAVPAKQSDAFEEQLLPGVHLFDEFEKLGRSYHIAE